MLYNAILSGISQLSPLDGPANSDLQRLTCVISIRNDLGLRGNIFKMLHKAHNALENQFLLRVTIFPSKQSKELWFENVAVQSQVISYTNKTRKML